MFDMHRRRVSRAHRSRSQHSAGSRAKSNIHRSASRDHVSESRTSTDKLIEMRNARDNYLDFLKQKYPAWNYQNQKTNELSTNHVSRQPIDYGSPVPVYAQPRTSILSRMETSQYFWNRGPSEASSLLNAAAPDRNYRSVELLPVGEPIPTSSIFLETDLPNVRERLENIRTHLTELKDFRLSMPTTEYFRKVAPDVRADLRNVKSYYGPEERADIASMAEIRVKILNLDLNVEKRAREILDEAYGRQRWKPEVRPSPPATMEMPQWMKEQPPSAVEQLINKKEGAVVPFEELKESHPPQPEPLKPVIEERVKSPEAVKSMIAPSRSFVLPTTTTKANQASEAKPVVSSVPPKPQSSTSDDSDASDPKKSKQPASYNALLELLKPKKIEVSTDSSSDSDGADLVFGPKSRAINVPPPAPKPIATLSVAPKPVPANDLLAKLNLAPTPAADSDDDFFN